MRFKLVAVGFCIFFLLSNLLTYSLADHEGEFHLHVRDFAADQDDEYVCETIAVNQSRLYITKFTPALNKDRVHHMLIFGCQDTPKGHNRRGCFGPCLGESRIMYAWANNAPDLELPKDVSFEVGSDTTTKYIVIQLHYKDKFSEPDSSGIRMAYTEQKTENLAGIYLFIPNGLTLPAGQSDVRIVWNCSLVNEKPIYVFAARVHAHGFSRANAVFAREKDSKEWQLVVERSPQRPQAFYPLEKPYMLHKDLKVAGRCIYDMSSTNTSLGAGFTRQDEMCNIYLMFYTKDDQFNYGACGGMELLPAALQLPEPDPVEMSLLPNQEHAHHHHHEHESHDHHHIEETVITEVSSSEHSFFSLSSPGLFFILLMALLAVAIAFIFRRRVVRIKYTRSGAPRYVPVTASDEIDLLDTKFLKSSRS